MIDWDRVNQPVDRFAEEMAELIAQQALAREWKMFRRVYPTPPDPAVACVDGDVNHTTPIASQTEYEAKVTFALQWWIDNRHAQPSERLARQLVDGMLAAR